MKAVVAFENSEFNCVTAASIACFYFMFWLNVQSFYVTGVKLIRDRAM